MLLLLFIMWPPSIFPTVFVLVLVFCDGNWAGRQTRKRASSSKRRQIVSSTTRPPHDVWLDMPEVPSHEYIGYAAGKHFWLSNDKYTQSEAVQGCQDILAYFTKNNEAPVNQWIFYPAIGDNENERQEINLLMTLAGEKTAWLGSKTKVVKGRSIIMEQGSNGFIIRENTRSHKKKRKMHPGQRWKREVSMTSGGFTFMDTHYPWIPAWQAAPDNGGCRVISGCEPRECTVVTPPCTLEEPENGTNCDVQTDAMCHQVDSGPCTAICEQCEITQDAECWMTTTKCEIIKNRECQITEPECTVETPPCTVDRPPCVTRMPPCVAQNSTVNSTECETSPPCGTAQGITCTTTERPCTPEEIEAGKDECSSIECEANPLCLKPDYCGPGRTGNIALICPAPVTFCPPEIVRCPAPRVSCNEPVINCSQPEYHCAPSEVTCSQPEISCSAAKTSCPDVITSCRNPVYRCDPPQYNCPKPTMECKEPKPCLIEPPKNATHCPVICEGDDCQCQIFQQTDSLTWGQVAEKCDASHKGLCAGHEK